jgi:hypothetical protein
MGMGRDAASGMGERVMKWAGCEEASRGRLGRDIGREGVAKCIRVTDSLPKTRSGKIMRRVLWDIAAGKNFVGETGALEDCSALAKRSKNRGITVPW